ncbi:hypothetical protein [Streptomyces sp. NPDC005732]|uniref:hypothetical protein n=1 Tax=Streptomyces sp. NPDC005732 TaxID=3157057 RepID=UPI0033C9E34B
MRLPVRRVDRQYATTIERVNAATEAAIGIVEAQMRGKIGDVQVAVASSASMWELVVDAHRPMFGRQDPGVWLDDRNAFGTSTITQTGVLVVVNAQACRGRTVEIDKTLLHEFTHAVQFGRPGARDLIMRSLANNYGIRPMSERDARVANRRVESDERQAARMERHHRQLAQSI